MKLTIENLGPIDKGVIDLEKRLIILTGPNNTGKSYLTYLIHAISQFESLEGVKSVSNKIRRIFKPDYINKITSNSEVVYVPTVLKDHIYDFSEVIKESVINNTSKIFASQSIKFNVSIDLTNENFENLGIIYERLKIIDGRLTVLNLDETINDQVFYTKTFKDYEDINSLTERALYIICFILLESKIIPNTYFFPAERTAINLFAKHITATKAEIKDELDAELIAGMSNEELGERLRSQVKAAPKYPYAIRDYINFVNNFKPAEKEVESEFNSIANKIESILIGGRVHLNKFNQLIFTPKKSEIPLELHLSSSLVKSLSYLILYLRYSAKKDDQIIIDEPELNLHPDLQVALAKIIVEIVNAGLKVIISTHSDYLVKEINNLILLQKLPKSEETTLFLTQHNYRTEHLLDSKKVGAYFLNDHTINPIDVETNGIEVPSINEAMSSIDSMAQEIFFRLEE